MTRRAATYAVGSALLVLVVAVWYVGLWAPRSRQITQVMAQQAAATTQQAQLVAELSQLQAAAKTLTAKEAALSKMSQAVPGTPDVAPLILQINKAAKQAGVDFLSIAPSKPVAATPSGSSAEPGGSPSTIQLSINVTGGFFQLLDFIDHMDALPRIVVINSLGLNPGGAGPTSATTPPGAGGSGPGAVGVPPVLNVSISATVFTTQVPVAPGSTTTTTAPAKTSTPGAPSSGTSTTTGKG
ncbi:MAG: type 4a pilus biogenesis protein PilO [Acidimicrobiales bacterium]